MFGLDKACLTRDYRFRFMWGEYPQCKNWKGIVTVYHFMIRFGLKLFKLQYTNKINKFTFDLFTFGAKLLLRSSIDSWSKD